MLAVAGEVHRAPKNVENTAIDRDTSNPAEPLIQALWIGTEKILDTADAEIFQVSRDTRANAGNLL